MSEELTGRLITEEEWRAHRAASLAQAPDRLAQAGGIPQVLISYQQRLLAATAIHQVTVVEKSRRTGITWAAGADAVLTSAADRTTGGMDTFYIGYNKEMAREFIDTCAMWSRMFMSATTLIEELLFQDDDPDKFIQAFRIKFASGFQIVALASRPRSLRGMQGYVIIDEAAFHDDLDGVLTAALALLMWGGRVLVISTHNGADNPFNKLILDIRSGRKPYALIHLDFDEALREGLYERIAFVTDKVWSPEAEAKWRADIVAFYGDSADEELFCVPSEGDGAWLTAPLIEVRQRANVPVMRIARKDEFTHWPEHLREADVKEWCERELQPLLSNLDPQLNHYLGGDYGRVSDLSVLWPLAVTKTMKRITPFVVEMKNMPFDQQKQILKYICDRLPRLCAQKHDATGLGMAIAEFAVQQYGEHRCEPVMLSQNWYRENAQPLKSAFEDDAIEIPKDADIASDLRLVAIKNGIAHIPALKSGVKKDRHGDAAVALMLANAATRATVSEYGYEPVRPETRGGADWLFPESSSAGRSLW